MAEKAKHIGNRINVVEQDYYIDNKIITRFHPQIQVNGRLMFITNKENRDKIVEYNNRDVAIKYAENCRDKLKMKYT